MFEEIKPNEEEARIIDEALAMPLSEVVNLPKACYTNEFDIKVTSIRALLLVKGEVRQIEYPLREVLYVKPNKAEPSESIDSPLKLRILSLIELGKALSKALCEYYDEFEDIKLDAVNTAYNDIVKLVLTPIE